jgi:hypothetical protein
MTSWTQDISCARLTSKDMMRPQRCYRQFVEECRTSYHELNFVIYSRIRGRVSKYVTDGSKTAVIDKIISLYVSLGSSTVQLHESLGSRCEFACSEAGFNSQTGGRSWGVCYRRATFCCAFLLWANGLNAKDIHKGMFPVYVRTCLSRKAVHP